MRNHGLFFFVLLNNIINHLICWVGLKSHGPPPPTGNTIGGGCSSLSLKQPTLLFLYLRVYLLTKMFTFLLREEGGFFLGEAILVKLAVADGGVNMSGFPTEGKFEDNVLYKCTKSGNYWVTCIGGGGAAGSGAYLNISYTWSSPISGEGKEKRYANVWGSGGGSGYVNNGVFYLNEGDEYQITIGSGGVYKANSIGGSGGTTSFGTLLSAQGGTGGNTPVSLTNVEKWSNVNAGLGYNNGTRCYSASSNTGSESSGNGRGGEIYVNLNALGYLQPSKNNKDSAIYCGNGGSGNKTSPYYGSNGTSGCVFVNFIN